MPIYQFRCARCNHLKEKITFSIGTHPPPCPSCGGTMRLVYGSVNHKFVGSGFYETDYKTNRPVESEGN
jgi:putative FmdB family regulatory protein